MTADERGPNPVTEPELCEATDKEDCKRNKDVVQGRHLPRSNAWPDTLWPRARYAKAGLHTTSNRLPASASRIDANGEFRPEAEVYLMIIREINSYSTASTITNTARKRRSKGERDTATPRASATTQSVQFNRTIL